MNLPELLTVAARGARAYRAARRGRLGEWAVNVALATLVNRYRPRYRRPRR